MKKLGMKAYEEVKAWMYRNARPLDLALWQFHFENGGREKVLELLRCYQNEDGGFGHALEPDCWNEESSPYTTWNAAGILQRIGLVDGAYPMIRDILHYLEGTAACSGEGWFFSIPSNDGCPRAPWWSYNAAANQNIGLTASLCAFVLRFGDKQSAVYEKASGYVDGILAKFTGLEELGEMGAGGLGMLLQTVEECGLTDRFDVSVIRDRIREMVDCSIERDPDKWKDYTPRPSEFIWSAESPFYPGNEEIVEKELDYTIETRNPNGVWDITWTWFDLGGRYAKEFAISENWWKAKIAMDKLMFLQSFGRI